MRHFLSFLVSFFYVLNVVAAPAWFPEGIQTKGSSTIGEKSTANSSAVLDVRSTTKGMLPPRMTTAQRTAIASPATGLLVYDTDTLTVWQYNGSGWIEVGSGGTSGAQYNVIANYGFEATSYSEDWTASGGTLAAAAGSNILFGAQSATWDASASTQTLSYASQAIGEGYKSNNCEGAIYIKTPSGTATHTVQVWDGTNVLASVTVYSTTTAKQFSTGPFPCPSSGNWQLRVVANADEPLIALDDAYLGLARNVAQCGVDTPAVSFTPMGSWTTNTTYTGKWWRRGDRYHYELQVALSGNPNSASLTITRAPGLTIDTSKLVSTTTDGRKFEAQCRIRSAGVVYNGSGYYNGGTMAVVVPNVASTYPFGSNVTQVLPATFTNGDVVICEGSVPIVGWEASQCVTPERQRTPKITNYLSGSGTHTWSSGVTYARIRMLGGGGGGGSSGTASWGAATSGGNTTFGDAAAAGGGAASTVSGGLAAGGTGGSATLGSITGMGWTGGGGGGATYNGTSYARGGQGGASCVGGAPRSTNQNTSPGAQSNNKGVGGTGAGISSVAGGTAGAGGGAGACIDGLLYNPSGSTSYAVGSAGTGGSAGAGGSAGGDGSNGMIEITEYFGYTTAILANSVSTPIANGLKVATTRFTTTTGPNACAVAGSIDNSWISGTPSSSGAGQCSFTMASGYFSAQPDCQFTVRSSPAGISVSGNTSSATAGGFQIWDAGGMATAGSVVVTCIGPR